MGKRGGIFQTCTEVHGPPEQATLSAGVHPADPLILHTAENSVPIALQQGMDEEEKEAAIRYGTYASVNKEAEFINAEMVKQVQAGHVTVFSFGSSQLPPYPVALFGRSHPLGGKEAATYF